MVTSGTAFHYQRAYNSSMCPGHSGVPCGRVIGMRGRMAKWCFDCAEHREFVCNMAKHAREREKRQELKAKGLPLPSKKKTITRPSELRDRIFAESWRKAVKLCPVCYNMPWARTDSVCGGCGLPHQEERVQERSILQSSAALALSR